MLHQYGITNGIKYRYLRRCYLVCLLSCVLSLLIPGGTSALETLSWSSSLRRLGWTSWRERLLVATGGRVSESSPMNQKRESRRRTSRTKIWTSSSKCLFPIGRSWPSARSLTDSWSGNVRWEEPLHLGSVPFKLGLWFICSK